MKKLNARINFAILLKYSICVNMFIVPLLVGYAVLNSGIFNTILVALFSIVGMVLNFYLSEKGREEILKPRF